MGDELSECEILEEFFLLDSEDDEKKTIQT